MHLRKILKALLFAALIFVFAVAAAACDIGANGAGDIGASDNVTRPDDGDIQNPDDDNPEPEPDPPTEPDVPEPDIPSPPDKEDPVVPDVPVDPEPSEPDPPVGPETPTDPNPSDPEPDKPDPDNPETPVDPPDPEEPDPPVDPDPEEPNPELPVDPDSPDPEKPIDPDPTEPDDQPPQPIFFNYVFVYGLNHAETVSGTAAQGVYLNALTADFGVPYYNFVGWQVNGDTAEFPYLINADTIFTAIYQPIIYKVAYELNGGVQNVKNPVDYTCENSELPLFEPSRQCYKFGGWFLDAALTERAEKLAPAYPQDLTLYAKWQTPAHNYGEDHICIDCGEKTSPEHIYNAAHVCTVCSKAHERSTHLYDATHSCAICGASAVNKEHTYNADHVCTVCGNSHLSEDHVYGADFLCKICGAAHAENEHVFNDEHLCKICGKPHVLLHHMYGDDFLCMVCGAAHADHIYDAKHACNVCGKPHAKAEHEYNENYICVICGHEFTGTRPWRGDIAAAFAAGNGTQESPFMIADGAELALLAKLIDSGAADAKGPYGEKYYTLAADIDLGGREWMPIGKGFYESSASKNLDNAFKGNFDGNGKTVSNFVITSPSNAVSVANNKNTYYAVGLFGALNGGSVLNLNIKDFTVTITDPSVSAAYNAGGIAGVATERSTIADCSVRGEIGVNVCGTVNVGLAVGDSEASNTANAVTIVNTHVFGSVVGQGGKQTTVGGLIGLNGFGAARGCYADVTVTAESDTAAYGAGLIGIYKSLTHIDDCYALGNVSVKCKTANKTFADGFLNKTATSEKWIKNCLRLDTQSIMANGKPTVGKTAAVKAATADEIAAAASQNTENENA